MECVSEWMGRNGRVEYRCINEQPAAASSWWNATHSVPVSRSTLPTSALAAAAAAVLCHHRLDNGNNSSKLIKEEINRQRESGRKYSLQSSVMVIDASAGRQEGSQQTLMKREHCGTARQQKLPHHCWSNVEQLLHRSYCNQAPSLPLSTVHTVCTAVSGKNHTPSGSFFWFSPSVWSQCPLSTCCNVMWWRWSVAAADTLFRVCMHVSVWVCVWLCLRVCLCQIFSLAKQHITHLCWTRQTI